MVESEAFADESERKEAFVSIPRVNHNFGRVQLKPKARKRHRRPPRNSAAFLEDFSETQKLNFFLPKPKRRAGDILVSSLARRRRRREKLFGSKQF